MTEHAIPGGRRERHREHELRVVLDAHAIREIGPAPVEDELALAVHLRVCRRGSDELVAVVEREMAGEPSGRFTDALRFLEALEPRVLDERRAALAKERIPGLARDVLDAGN